VAANASAGGGGVEYSKQDGVSKFTVIKNLKGQCREIFLLRFFFHHPTPSGSLIPPPKIVSILVSNLPTYSNLKFDWPYDTALSQKQFFKQDRFQPVFTSALGRTVYMYMGGFLYNCFLRARAMPQNIL
jgi:hypothetical protein